MFDMIKELWLTLPHWLRASIVVFGSEGLFFLWLFWYADRLYKRSFGVTNKKTGKPKTNVELWIEEQERKEKERYR